jgi:hypothetical protein
MFGKFKKKFGRPDSEEKKLLGQMYFVHPTIGEPFFLCLLVTIIPGATSFKHFRTIDNTEHPTF